MPIPLCIGCCTWALGVVLGDNTTHLVYEIVKEQFLRIEDPRGGPKGPALVRFYIIKNE